MPSWVTQEGKWAEAKRAAQKQGLSEKDGDKFWRLVAGIYKKMVNYHKAGGYVPLGNPITPSQDIHSPSYQGKPDPIEEKPPEKQKKTAKKDKDTEKPKKEKETEVKKAEHLSPADRSRIASLYKQDPSKWSVRSLADHLGFSRHQVADVVRTLPQSTKSDEHVQEKQSKHARWLGKKLPSEMVHAVHEGRNKQIETRPQTSMEAPVDRWLKKFGISFRKQVEVSELVGKDDPELGIVDFYIPNKRLIINSDGPRHSLKNVSTRIHRQDALLRAKGYKVVHITTSDMNQDRMKDILRGAVNE